MLKGLEKAKLTATQFEKLRNKIAEKQSKSQGLTPAKAMEDIITERANLVSNADAAKTAAAARTPASSATPSASTAKRRLTKTEAERKLIKFDRRIGDIKELDVAKANIDPLYKAAAEEARAQRQEGRENTLLNAAQGAVDTATGEFENKQYAEEIASSQYNRSVLDLYARTKPGKVAQFVGGLARLKNSKHFRALGASAFRTGQSKRFYDQSVAFRKRNIPRAPPVPIFRKQGKGIRV